VFSEWAPRASRPGATRRRISKGFTVWGAKHPSQSRTRGSKLASPAPDGADLRRDIDGLAHAGRIRQSHQTLLGAVPGRLYTSSGWPALKAAPFPGVASQVNSISARAVSSSTNIPMTAASRSDPDAIVGTLIGAKGELWPGLAITVDLRAADVLAQIGGMNSPPLPTSDVGQWQSLPSYRRVV
jgi:hypothetical protein